MSEFETQKDRGGSGPRIREVPKGDTHERLVCPDCGFINYENPLIVAGSVIVEDGKVLLCRRAIEPRRGFWTIPAGYLELNETVEAGACREAREEANADIKIDGLLAVYTIARISQVQLIYAAHMKTPSFSPGLESLEVQFFAWDQVPYDEIAFPSVHWALQHRQEWGGRAMGTPFTNPEGETGDYPTTFSE